MMTFSKLQELWKSTAESSGAFNSAMLLLTDYQKDLMGWQDKCRKLESELQDYRDRENLVDTAYLRSEVRALQTRVNSLESSLKLKEHTENQ